MCRFLKSGSLGLLLVWLLTGCASHSRNMAQGSPKAKAQIETRLQEIFAAAEAKDFARLETYHLYGPKFSRFSGSAPGRLDAATTARLERDGMAALERLRMRAEDLKIDLFGAVGIATFILDYSFDSSGQTVRKKDRCTLVFVKDRGAWKIAHEHLSAINL